MSQTQNMTLEQAIVGLLNAVTVAQQRGAFNLQEAATLFEAYRLVESFHKSTLSRQQAPRPAVTPTPPAPVKATPAPVPAPVATETATAVEEVE